MSSFFPKPATRRGARQETPDSPEDRKPSREGGRKDGGSRGTRGSRAGGDDAPRRQGYGDQRGAAGDRPPRTSGQPDRIRRDGEAPSRARRDDDRPARSRADGDKPARTYKDGDRPSRTYKDGGRPSHAYKDGDKPARTYKDGDRPSHAYKDGGKPPRARRDDDEKSARGQEDARPSRRPRDDDRPFREHREEGRERPARHTAPERHSGGEGFRREPGPNPGVTGEGREENAHLLPGIKPVSELLESSPERVDAVFLRKGRHGKEMERIVDLCRSAGVRFSLLETTAFARVYSGKSQGVVARLYESGFVELEELLAGVMDAPVPLVLVLDQVQDPGNAGTLARTLYSLGGAGLIVPRHNGVYLGAAAAKAAAGALEHLPVAKAANLGQALDAAKKQGFTIYGAASGTEGDADKTEIPVVDIFTLTPRLPALLVLGGEEGGLRPGMEKRCDVLLRIPMLRSFDSLNVAQAGAIIVSWFSHRGRGELSSLG